MEFTIDRKQFLDRISTAARAISAYSPLPQLSGILIEVKPDRIILTGSDNSLAIQTVVTPGELNQLDIRSTGSAVVDARYLLEIVRKMESAMVTLELVDYALIRVSGDNARFNLNGSDHTEYPPVDFSNPSGHFTLKPEQMHQIVSQTAFACSDKDQRPVLKGINFRAEGTKLVCSASDSYRLARKELELDSPQDFNITVAVKSLQEAVKSLHPDTEVVDVYADRRKIQFQFDKTIIQSRLIDGSFPDVERIVPAGGSYALEMDAGELFRAIDRTNFIKRQSTHLVKLDCSEDEVRLLVNSSEIGNANQLMQDAVWTGAPLSLLLNGTYVSEALKALGKERVRLDFNGSLHPVLLTAPDDPTVKMVVVPVKDYA